MNGEYYIKVKVSEEKLNAALETAQRLAYEAHNELSSLELLETRIETAASDN